MKAWKLTTAIICIFAVTIMASVALAPIASAETATEVSDKKGIIHIDLNNTPTGRIAGYETYWDSKNLVCTYADNCPLRIDSAPLNDGTQITVKIEKDLVVSNYTNDATIFCSGNLLLTGNGSLTCNNMASALLVQNDITIKDFKMLKAKFVFEGINSKFGKITIENSGIWLESLGISHAEPVLYSYISSQKGIFCNQPIFEGLKCYDANGNEVSWESGKVCRIGDASVPGIVTIDVKDYLNITVEKAIIIACAAIAIICFGYALLGRSKKTA